jgi:hypothetical protein
LARPGTGLESTGFRPLRSLGSTLSLWAFAGLAPGDPPRLAAPRLSPASFGREPPGREGPGLELPGLELPDLEPPAPEPPVLELPGREPPGRGLPGPGPLDRSLPLGFISPPLSDISWAGND